MRGPRTGRDRSSRGSAWRGWGRALLLALAVAGALASAPARADETGNGHYTPGTFGYSAGIVPPERGFYYTNYQTYYEGSVLATKSLPIGGLVRNGVKTVLFGEILNPLYVTGAKVLGGTLAATVVVPFIYLDNTALSSTGSSLSITEDTNFNLGDIYVAPVVLGWDRGNFHWNVMGGIYAPVGEWKFGQLSPTGKNYWTFEPATGFTYLNPKSGWEISTFQGVDFNTINPGTNYQSGIDYHLDWVIAKHVTRAVEPPDNAAALKARGPSDAGTEKGGDDRRPRKPAVMDVAPGIGGYFYYQLTGDSGAGAVLGPFKGRVFALGPTLQGTANFSGKPVTFQLKVLKEIHTEHRTQGVSSWANLSLKL